MKKIRTLILLATTLFVLTPTTVKAEKTTHVGVSFFVQDENKGVQFIQKDNSMYIKNFERLTFQLTNKETRTVESFESKQEMMTPYHLNEKTKYIITIVDVP